MSKHVTWAFLLLIVLQLAACGSSLSETSSTDNRDTSATKTDVVEERVENGETSIAYPDVPCYLSNASNFDYIADLYEARQYVASEYGTSALAQTKIYEAFFGGNDYVLCVYEQGEIVDFDLFVYDGDRIFDRVYVYAHTSNLKAIETNHFTADISGFVDYGDDDEEHEGWSGKVDFNTDSYNRVLSVNELHMQMNGNDVPFPYKISFVYGLDGKIGKVFWKYQYNGWEEDEEREVMRDSYGRIVGILYDAGGEEYEIKVSYESNSKTIETYYEAFIANGDDRIISNYLMYPESVKQNS